MIAGSQQFESLLQRRAKPIQWKWSQDLSRSLTKESLRQRRFLHDETETTVKWWEKMMSERNEKITSPSETYFGRYSASKRNRLAEILRTGASVSNRTELERENFQHELNNYQSLSESVSPFEKQADAFDAKKYLTPTEKTTLNSYYVTPTFERFSTFPPGRELEDKKEEKFQDIPSTDDVGNKIEKQITEQHTKESLNAQREVENRVFKSIIPSVEYVVSDVEHVVPQVEYADSNYSIGEQTIPSTIPGTQYISSDVEFVEPEIIYIEDGNMTEVEVTTEKEKSPMDQREILVEDWPDVETFPLKPEYKPVKEGGLYQIVGLRREQVRVRRNYARNLQLGLPEIDYPALEALPVLQFYCGDYLPGYYVDITTKCQVFHICDENGQRSSFLCPVGTLFNQEYLVCDWWYNVDCRSSLIYYRTDSLQAYGSTSDNQKMQSEPGIINEKSNREAMEADRHYKQKPFKQSSKLVNTHQKSVNYPIGYAILLREYMKNSDTAMKDDPQNWEHNFEWDDDETGTKILYSKYSQHKKDNLDKNVQKSYQQPFISFPRDEHVWSDTHKNPRTSGERNFAQNQLNKQDKYENRNNYEISTEKENPQNQFGAHNLTQTRSILYNPKLEEPSLSDEHERENPSFVIQNPKNSGTESEKIPILPTAKPGRVSKIDLDKYHFIINPKEAIISTKTQYAEIDKHLISNDSFIKFKHGKSIIKHINPKNSKTVSSSKQPKDNLAQYSEPTYNKATRPRTSYQYGDRISIKSRSIPENIENLYLHETKMDLKPVSSSRLPHFVENLSNSTEESLPLASQNHMKFAQFNTASDVFANNYKAEKEKTFNETDPFYSKIINADNEYLSDKRKITISVRIEQKKVMMEDLRKNNSQDSYFSQQKLTDNLKNSPSSKPQKLKNLFSNMPKSKKSKHLVSQNSTSKKPENAAKVTNTYGGFSITKILGDTFRTSHEGREETQLYPVYIPPTNKNLQNSMAMPNQND